MSQPADIDIARSTRLLPMEEIAASIGVPQEALIPFGRDKAKISLDFVSDLDGRKNGRLILVTAMTPTPAGEGKTTTSVGLCDGLNRIGRKAMVCLREPSLGPCFGMKGGAAGGGHAQVVPMEDINLHFTGDFHAISAANNLLAAMIDNHFYWSNGLGIDLRRISWRRVVDMNDRSLRQVVTSLGGVANGFPREGAFDITVASEVMAILCLTDGLKDLERRLGDIVVAETRKREPITAREIRAEGAMAVLLKDALAPNLVQTLENNPAFIHGGPFANIAHGCNSLIATKTALKLVDYVVTEAGFGADLGAEKFFDIKCRAGGLKPDAAVVVATVRALRWQGGADRETLNEPSVARVKKGLANLARHVQNVKKFGVPVVVAINLFEGDTEEELQAVERHCAAQGVKAIRSSHWAEGGRGAEALAEEVARLADAGMSQFSPLYCSGLPLWEKARTIATEIYGADDIIADKKVRDRFRQFQDMGYGDLPVCMAKTQYSFSTDPKLRGAPSGHVVPIREVRLAAGARFVVAVCGEIMTMPGLPRHPAAENIRLDEEGKVQGLF